MLITSFYCYTINFKKRKGLHVGQLCMFILRHYCTKMSDKKQQSCLFYIHVQANITLLMHNWKYVFNVFFLTYQRCMSAMNKYFFTKDF